MDCHVCTPLLRSSILSKPENHPHRAPLLVIEVELSCRPSLLATLARLYISPRLAYSCISCRCSTIVPFPCARLFLDYDRQCNNTGGLSANNAAYAMCHTDTPDSGNFPLVVGCHKDATAYPMPHTSSPTHSKVTVSPWRGPGEHNGSLSNVGHRADEPSDSVSSSHKP